MSSVIIAAALASTGTCEAKTEAKKGGPTKQKFVSGILYDSPFVMTDAFVSPKKLLLRTATSHNRSGVTSVHLTYRQYLQLNFPQDEKLEGQTFSFKSTDKQMLVGEQVQPAPILMLSVLMDNYDEVIQPTEPYTLALTFYKSTRGMLPGYINVQSDGVHKIHLSGYFYAKLSK